MPVLIGDYDPLNNFFIKYSFIKENKARKLAREEYVRPRNSRKNTRLQTSEGGNILPLRETKNQNKEIKA